MQVLGAGLLFWTLRALRPQKVVLRDLPKLLLCAVFGVAVNQMMFFHGLIRTAPVNASIIMVATPILVLVLAGVLIDALYSGKTSQFIETQVKFEDGRTGKVSADLAICEVKTFPVMKKAA